MTREGPSISFYRLWNRFFCLLPLVVNHLKAFARNVSGLLIALGTVFRDAWWDDCHGEALLCLSYQCKWVLHLLHWMTLTHQFKPRTGPPWSPPYTDSLADTLTDERLWRWPGRYCTELNLATYQQNLWSSGGRQNMLAFLKIISNIYHREYDYLSKGCWKNRLYKGPETLKTSPE